MFQHAQNEAENLNSAKKSAQIYWFRLLRLQYIVWEFNLFLKREIWGLNREPVKLDTILPTALHRCDVFSKVLSCFASRRNDSEITSKLVTSFLHWSHVTSYSKYCIMQDLIWLEILTLIFFFLPERYHMKSRAANLINFYASSSSSSVYFNKSELKFEFSKNIKFFKVEFRLTKYYVYFST